jgi:hypothetical protein
VDESKNCLLGGHRRGQLRDIRADVPDRATRDRAANRLSGD